MSAIVVSDKKFMCLPRKSAGAKISGFLATDFCYVVSPCILEDHTVFQLLEMFNPP